MISQKLRQVSETEWENRGVAAIPGLSRIPELQKTLPIFLCQCMIHDFHGVEGITAGAVLNMVTAGGSGSCD